MEGVAESGLMWVFKVPFFFCLDVISIIKCLHDTFCVRDAEMGSSHFKVPPVLIVVVFLSCITSVALFNYNSCFMASLAGNFLTKPSWHTLKSVKMDLTLLLPN